MTTDEFNQRLQQVPGVVAAETRRAMEASLVLIEADARTLARRDVGRLQGSISYQISGSFPLLEGRVGPSIGYGVNVEYGRRPGARMPPVEALMGWVSRHFQDQGPGVARMGQAALRRRAFALARAIARRGIPARPFMQPAYEKNAGRIEALFGEVGVRIVATIGGQPA